MGFIPPIPPNSMDPANPGGDLAKELWNMIEEFRHLMGEWEHDKHSPALLEKIESCMRKLQSFMETHKKQLFQIMENQGWSPTGMEGFENYYDALLSSIHIFLEKPNTASLDMVNAEATQIHWLMTHHS